jgi:hypothetical protein
VPCPKGVKEETGVEIRAGKVIGRRVHPDTGRALIYLAARPAGEHKGNRRRRSGAGGGPLGDPRGSGPATARHVRTRPRLPHQRAGGLMAARQRKGRSAGGGGAYPYMTKAGLRYMVKGPVRLPDGTIKRIDRRTASTARPGRLSRLRSSGCTISRRRGG